MGKISAVNQVLAVWGQLLQSALLDYLGVTRESCLISYKSVSQQVGFLDWLFSIMAGFLASLLRFGAIVLF